MMENPLVTQELYTIAQDFIWNADNTLADSSPFYEMLARRIAHDPELLALAAHSRAHQPAVNMLFSSVHYLVLRGSDDPLTQFYADIARGAKTEDDPFPIFRAFCLEHAPEIISLIESHRVQTNEVARCSYFLPAFTLISRELEGKAFALIEVGSSAGLNLNWDRYAYDYGDGEIYGEANSTVRLSCELRGEGRPPLSPEMPPIVSRIGIDLHPNDVFDEDAMLWLRALTWPEQIHRAQRLQNAIAIGRQHPPLLAQGDALELVPRLVRDIPADVPVVLFHSFVLNQLPAELRELYFSQLAELGAFHMLYDVGVEPSAWPTPMTLTRCRDGDSRQEVLATCDHHGRWMEWNRGE